MCCFFSSKKWSVTIFVWKLKHVWKSNDNEGWKPISDLKNLISLLTLSKNRFCIFPICAMTFKHGCGVGWPCIRTFAFRWVCRSGSFLLLSRFVRASAASRWADDCVLRIVTTWTWSHVVATRVPRDKGLLFHWQNRAPFRANEVHHEQQAFPLLSFSISRDVDRIGIGESRNCNKSKIFVLRSADMLLVCAF